MQRILESVVEQPPRRQLALDLANVLIEQMCKFSPHIIFATDIVYSISVGKAISMLHIQPRQTAGTRYYVHRQLIRLIANGSISPSNRSNRSSSSSSPSSSSTVHSDVWLISRWLMSFVSLLCRVLFLFSDAPSRVSNGLFYSEYRLPFVTGNI